MTNRRVDPVPVPTPWIDLSTHRQWLGQQTLGLLEFGKACALPAGGSAYLDDDGNPDPAQGIQTWITCRMAHSYSLGALLGYPGCAPVADAAVAGLLGVLQDEQHGGWFHAVDAAGQPDLAAGKTAYDHAFVMLAGSSAVIAGRPRGAELLEAATQTYLERFWDPNHNRPVDTWNADFTTLDDYRGLNASMHSVEAMLSVAAAVPPEEAGAWRARAGQIAQFVMELAAKHHNRLPEHFGPTWEVDLELNADKPDDQFKPYGATPGHGLEWARLLLHLEAATETSARLVATAEALFHRAVADGWDADGAQGFIYTTDWTGKPVVRTRMHWVVCEAIATAATLWERTGETQYADWYATWWDYADRYFIDHRKGSWHHELDVRNRPAAAVWPGKPDLYHALQCTLIPRLPLQPMLAGALRAGLLRP